MVGSAVRAIGELEYCVDGCVQICRLSTEYPDYGRADRYFDLLVRHTFPGTGSSDFIASDKKIYHGTP